VTNTRSKILLGLGCTALLLAGAFLVARTVELQNPGAYSAAVLASNIIALTNSERGGVGARALTEHPRLSRAAQAKANDMALRGYFSHRGPDGKTPWQWVREAGYEYRSAGENLAVRFTESSDVVRAWMNSPSHRANLVKAGYTQIGVGVAEGLFEGQRAVYVVEYFATPTSAFAKTPLGSTVVERPTITPLAQGAAVAGSIDEVRIDEEADSIELADY